MRGLDTLNELTTTKKFKPSDVDILQFLFWERGISLEEFDELPIPYIIRMAQVLSWQREQEAKASKKRR